jgi:hypothetical protein
MLSQLGAVHDFTHYFRVLGCIAVWCRQQGPPKRRYTTATLHGVTTKKNSTLIYTAMRTSNLALEFCIIF